MKVDAIVVGGGIVGLSAAWQLREAGLERVLLLERQLLAAGGSGLGTGSIHTQRWEPTDSALVLRSKHLVQELGTLSGQVFRLYPVGRLTLVGEDDVDTVRNYGAHLRDANVDALELSRDDLIARFPGMNVSDVGLGLYTKDDGTVYPTALVWALAGIFRGHGGTIWEGCGVQRIVRSDGAVRGVELTNGDIVASDRVILATGVWTKQALQASGLDLALRHAVTHNTVVTVGQSAMWSQVPSLLDGVQGVIAIPRNPGTIMAANTKGEHEATEEVVDAVLGTAAVQLRGNDESFAQEISMQQTEVLSQLRHRYRDYDIRGVVGHWAGLLDGTPDSHPFVGPYPGLRGLWVGCGLTGYGVQRGPAVGEVLANLALERPVAVNVDSYGLDRLDHSLPFKIDISGDNPFAGFQPEGQRR